MSYIILIISKLLLLLRTTLQVVIEQQMKSYLVSYKAKTYQRQLFNIGILPYPI